MTSRSRTSYSYSYPYWSIFLRMLALKVAALLILMIGVLVLTVRAKRFDFERFRTVHGRRKYRVPIQRSSTGPRTSTSPEDGDGAS